MQALNQFMYKIEVPRCQTHIKFPSYIFTLGFENRNFSALALSGGTMMHFWHEIGYNDDFDYECQSVQVGSSSLIIINKQKMALKVTAILSKNIEL